ncbi:hypothetical protein RHSIM_Rhsim02G0200300 [Rhododendron simsii]|uniref:F-box domain-containing protein n=1 Tax=Rhododendron simsii TaxID=118357 RepID=A0A834LTZ6_RHOSS|nr:hypothetical protein RHSIM_Rhsim02G0200300 [Rhododendron simsii]
MSKIFNCLGDATFCPGGSIYPNPKESSLFLSLGHDVDFYFPPCKRSRIGAPFLFRGEIFEQQQPASIEVLPDECLFEVFRRLPGGEDRSICASVSKRWLMLLTSIRNDEKCAKKATQPISSEPEEPLLCDKKGEVVGLSGDNNKDKEREGDGYLSRCLEGKKATDVRLASIAVGTGHRGGLGKLSIQGSHSIRGVTTLGFRAIGRCCPSLRVLSLWDVSSVGDEGLYEIANGCPLLEKLDLSKCPAISDNGLIAIAKKCPNLASLTIESCSNIGYKSLQAIGSFCHNLTSVSIKNCPLVGDQGISSLLSSTSCSLTNLKLQGLSISDVSLAVIGHYGKELTELVLIGLENVKERGFWVMGKGQGLQKLRSFTVTSCQGVTDLSLEAVGKGCPNLKHLCLRKCSSVSDIGLVSFSNSAVSLESLQLEECHTITGYGLSHVLFSSGRKLKALSLAKCLGFKDLVFGFPSVVCCTSLRSLSVCNCPGFGNFSMNMLGKLCPHLQHLELNGLHGLTDEALLPLIENSVAGLLEVNLGNCVNLTDKVITVLAKLHGVTLEQLNLDGCKKVTDASLVAIADNCLFLRELDASNCEITDSGIAALASALQLNLQILSLSGCSSISDMSLAYLMELGRTLLGLNIQQCNAISSRMVDFLVERLWRCDILS